MDRESQVEELKRCFDPITGPLHFVNTYVRILDPVRGEWIRFKLWPEQESTLRTIIANRLVVILKARQLGMTWLVLSYVLWLMVFRPVTVALIFSRRDTEATYLLDDRLKKMYSRLPKWMKTGQKIIEDNSHEWQLDNDSVARAFPTSAGDSYTATIAIVDEADLVHDLNRLMRAVKPTIDGGGRMILLSRADKDKPASIFKKIYRGAKAKLTEWTAVFLPWFAHPSRTPEWYERQKLDIQARTHHLDDLYEQYPATDKEALSASTADKRIRAKWLDLCYSEAELIEDESIPALPNLKIYSLPRPGVRYAIGIDPAEGNPTSNDSALSVLEVEIQEEVASLAGKFQPAAIGEYADQLGLFFNDADIMVERNNHGHAVLLWLDLNSNLKCLEGLDGRPGWLSTSKGKTILYSFGAEEIKKGNTKIHTLETYLQLASIGGSSLSAPSGELDDLADSFVLGLAGCVKYTTVKVWVDTMRVSSTY